MTSSVLRSSHRTLFVATILLGSLLLFLVQPMIARMALPRLGGAPAVWNSAMLVYQGLLLTGYAYAHGISKLAPGRQRAIHIAVLIVAGLTLPIGLSGAVPPPGANPFLWVPWLLIASIGPLFLAVATQAPLVQRWFVLAGGGDPYRLYAASNLGSFAGLIAYPLLVEPFMAVGTQSWLWSAGYALLVVLMLLCALRLPASAADQTEVAEESLTPSPRRIGIWILLSAVPSGLMLATTMHLTTDIVAMPLIWVVPLGLYLLSFSLAFGGPPAIVTRLRLLTPLFLLMGGSGGFLDHTDRPFLFGALSLALLFMACVSLHAELYQRRPAPDRLTGFYLAMSVGGMLGGVFCALLAPLIFNWAFEYPILILGAALLVKQLPVLAAIQPIWHAHGRLLGAVITLAAFTLAWAAEQGFGGLDTDQTRIAAGVVILALALASMGHKIIFTLCLAALMLSQGAWSKVERALTPGVMTRSYFGIYQVVDYAANLRYLVHGTTTHGIQDRNEGRTRTPISYYAAESGVGTGLAAVPQLFGADADVGVIGLGSGSLACYSQPGQRWRFYEIDPAIETIARDPARFTFLSQCAPKVPVVIGDARLTIAAETKGDAEALVIDAFSSDSIPMHLLTAEAFDTYERYLRPDGLLIVHISNRYLNLRPVLAAEKTRGWHGEVMVWRASQAELDRGLTHSIWVLMSKSPETISKVKTLYPERGWEMLDPEPGFRPWTDDYASILPTLKVLRD
jgi:hypothetical protein